MIYFYYFEAIMHLYGIIPSGGLRSEVQTFSVKLDICSIANHPRPVSWV